MNRNQCVCMCYHPVSPFSGAVDSLKDLNILISLSVSEWMFSKQKVKLLYVTLRQSGMNAQHHHPRLDVHALFFPTLCNDLINLRH